MLRISFIKEINLMGSRKRVFSLVAPFSGDKIGLTLFAFLNGPEDMVLLESMR